MHRRIITAAACAAIMLAAQMNSAPPADAAANCQARERIVAALADQFQETRRGFGLQDDMRILEVFAGESGSWTVVVSFPDGRSCVVAAGEAWTDQEAEPLGPEV